MRPIEFRLRLFFQSAVPDITDDTDNRRPFWIFSRIVKRDALAGTVTFTGWIRGNYILSNQDQYVVFESDGTNWYVIGGGGGA